MDGSGKINFVPYFIVSFSLSRNSSRKCQGRTRIVIGFQPPRLLLAYDGNIGTERHGPVFVRVPVGGRFDNLPVDPAPLKDGVSLRRRAVHVDLLSLLFQPFEKSDEFLAVDV